MSQLVVNRPEGLYCPAGDFYIDPWQPVERAVITHAHGDHARVGSAHYLASRESKTVLRSRLPDLSLQTLAYAEPLRLGSATVSLHPAGHVLGSSQVRIECGNEIWVVSGDYKLEADPTCTPFEPIRCDSFITESTFGLPIYRWRPQQEIMADINAWWFRNAEAGRTSLVFAYAFGKAQRVLAGVDASIGPIICHGAVEILNRAYREAGVALPSTHAVNDITDKKQLSRALVLAPPSAQSTPWLKRFGNYSDGFASGWMRLRGARRRRAVDRGFVLSDHADWPALQTAIRATGAGCVYVTHGYVPAMVRWLHEQGIDARAFETQYGGELDDASQVEEDEA
ncbi:MAG TPA: ligase-associated DNA damage response exonuclease [Burkholderiales bacterium]|nr:ligase-associated DNA damage response exonuclease [Burkholderiales bacterium]